MSRTSKRQAPPPTTSRKRNPARYTTLQRDTVVSTDLPGVYISSVYVFFSNWIKQCTYLRLEQPLQRFDHAGVDEHVRLVQVHHDARRVLVNGENHLLHGDITG